MVRIRDKLLLAYLLPAMLVLGAFGALAYAAMRRGLESELGKRLVSIAHAAAAQVDGALVDGLGRAFDEEGDLEVRRSRTFEYLRLRLATLRRSTGVRGLAVFDLLPVAGAGSPRVIRNLVEDTGLVAVGERSYAREADLVELARVFDAGEGRASVLFRGKDDVLYKSGYAPVLLGTRVVAAVGVDGPASFFEVLDALRGNLLWVGGALVLALGALAVFLAWRLSRPLRALSRAAEAIGAGDFSTVIRPETRDEVGVLARTMEEMRLRIEAREGELQLMLAGIAHEVRNPLGGIELYAGLLREDVAHEPKKLARVQKIERELAYLKNIVTDFLDYARKGPLETSPVDVTAWLDDVAGLVTADAERRGVSVVLDVSPQTPCMLADAEKLRRALLNLTRNALQAMPSGGTLTLGAQPAQLADAPAVQLSVRDTGEGMLPAVAAEAFTPFFTTRERGTGLGLAFVKKILDEHGGTVHVESAPGQGSRVTLIVRAATQEGAS